MLDSIRGLHVVLLIGLACFVQTEAQVCPFTYPGCSCYKQELTCYNLQTAPSFRLSEVTLQSGNIRTISKYSLPPGITSLVLDQLPLTNISNDAFDTSAETLQKLHINRAKLDTFPKALHKLTSLVELHIEDTPIQFWDSASLQQISQTLKVLELWNVNLSTWPGWISEFPYLSTLDLSYNPLKSIPGSALNLLTDTLTDLKLRGTRLTHVSKALSGLSNLTNLDLSLNNFTDATEFENITAPKLLSLALDLAGLKELPNLSKLTRLKQLSLYNNSIFDVPSGFLPSGLTYLHLGVNNLTSMPSDVAKLSNLSTLGFTNNQLTQIKPNSFPSSLNILYLNSNNLTHITNATFSRLYFLTQLYLDDNPISSIEPAAFSDLVSLYVLSLKKTHLTDIPVAFVSLGQQISIQMTTVQPLTCPCPVDTRLVNWFKDTYRYTLTSVTCSNGLSGAVYVTGRCDN